MPLGDFAVGGRFIAVADGLRSGGAPGKVDGIIFFVENATAGFDIISRAQALRSPWSVQIAGNALVAAGSASVQMATVSR
jgi:hypothetical protein